ncbi:pyridoxal phosphate-dependent aminotransferase [Roseovarius mucosus]|uniref:pyridoxal phosphate-dependent aminotransferase n=1 Tax=Roseovarius mucosus TaxID=215743 RepID=UPI003F703C7B
MTHTARRLAEVKLSPTAAISARAAELRLAGRDIINLGEGELDFDTPPHVADAGCAAIRAGATRYTPVAGTAALKAAVRTKFRTENALDYTPQQLIVGTGAKQLIFNAFCATLDPGDEVVVPVPAWVSYPDIVRLFGGAPILIECPRSQDFKLTPEALEAHITPRTRWLVLNSPCNPTGAVYSAAELRALADVLLNHPHVMVLSDDIYEHLIFDGRFATMAQVAPELTERVLTINGVSKVYSMTGWRIGYAGGPEWLIAAMETIQSQSTSNPSSIAQEAARAALEAPLTFFSPRLGRLRQRRDHLIDALGKTGGMLRAFIPEGAFYVYADCSALIGRTLGDQAMHDDVSVAATLLDEAGVAVVPGSAFGASPYLRIAYSVDDARLHEACDRIIDFCRRAGLV